MYPRIVIDFAKLNHNADTLLDRCANNHISSCFAVVKVFSGDLKIVEEIASHPFSYLADSRISNLKLFRHLNLPKALMRLPMLSEVDEVVKYADLSLNSEIKTIRKLDKAAKKIGKIHDIILMFDLGDLREGLFFMDDYIDIVDQILTLDNVHLKGIGTNLTCYGGVIPTNENLNNLVKIAHTIEHEFDITLDLISGGNSSSVALFGSGQIPSAINSLRLGEAIFFGRETAYGKLISGMHEDVFTVEAELIEIKQKPSYPIGLVGMNSFGEIPTIEDLGMMNRGIVAIGKQDVQLDHLTPLDPRITVVGGSSDHLILNLGDSAYQIGDIIAFRPNYPGLLHLMTSKYVTKKYLK
jgi:ornithine racemase